MPTIDETLLIAVFSSYITSSSYTDAEREYNVRVASRYFKGPGTLPVRVCVCLFVCLQL